MTAVEYVVEGQRPGTSWCTASAPTSDREQAIEDMAAVARVGGEQVYGPLGTSRLRVRAVTR